jgi:hypothetical protein
MLPIPLCCCIGFVWNVGGLGLVCYMRWRTCSGKENALPNRWIGVVSLLVGWWAYPAWSGFGDVTGGSCSFQEPLLRFWMGLALVALFLLFLFAVGMGRRVFYTTSATFGWYVVLDLSSSFWSYANAYGGRGCQSGRWWMDTPDPTSGETFGLFFMSAAAFALLWHIVPYVWRPASKPFVRWLGASWLHRAHAACLSGVIAMVVVVQTLSVLYEM